MENEDPFSELNIPKIVKQKLAKKFSSLATLSRAPAQEISEQVGISLKLAKTSITSARTILKQIPITAMDLLEEYKKKRKLTTGSQNLDEILAGGISTGSITEIIGEYASGKSQLTFQLCVNAQLPYELGGLEGSVYFIDTEGTFRPERIIAMAQRYPSLDPQEVLKNILVGRCYNTDHQIALIDKVGKDSQSENIGLIIIDSLTSHFRAEYIGRGTLAERQQKLNQHIHAILRIAEVSNLAVVATNQVHAKPDQFFGDPTAPVGGHVVAHAAQTRVMLRKSKGNR
ncbi:hypothetical protein LCGC14_3104430 [marine sediment metagenome]|uniref:DNA repair and recombination protein RadA n=1 Tax=marine sediment metagenome TaxID=412755 RepID=A0A0F8W6V2_9ZZZZ